MTNEALKLKATLSTSVNVLDVQENFLGFTIFTTEPKETIAALVSSGWKAKQVGENVVARA